jgi:hypothetical protein
MYNGIHQGGVHLLVQTGLDRYQKHSFIGILSGSDCSIKMVHFVWNYPTVGPQSGAGTARTVRLLRTSPEGSVPINGAHPKIHDVFHT